MTEEQKDILIAKMIDSPALLSDSELEAIIDDSDLREIYEMSVAVSAAYMGRRPIDAAQGWEHFKRHIKPKATLTQWALRIAAVWIGVMVVAGAVVGLLSIDVHPPHIASVGVKTDTIHPRQITTINVVSPDREIVAKAQVSDTPKRAEIPMHASVIDSVPQSEQLDIDEYMRIQQAAIDNEFAQLTAELVEDDYAALLQDCDDLDIDVYELERLIRNVTMQ